MDQDNKPVIGITFGDFNGISVEVILKALEDSRICKICTPVIYGSMRIISKYRKLLNLEEWAIYTTTTLQQISHKKVNLISIAKDKNFEIEPGKMTQEAGRFALESLRAATNDLKQGLLDAIVTAPINKYNIQADDFQFVGHTEYFTQEFEQKDSLMFMISPYLRMGLLTEHVPLAEVSNLITRERIFTKTNLMLQSLKNDFGIIKPRIALLGFNPHAGEEGLIGIEEQQVIKPAILELKKRGNLVFGPYPADGFFASGDYKKFDAILAMYHDQGLIPFKSLAFDEGVNFTAGLPIVRTSPDHGTAYSIAGKGIANEGSMRAAIFLAVDIVKYRKEMQAIYEDRKQREAQSKVIEISKKITSESEHQ
ncbi:MAG: 4-hydroxythreonine-4-phosphate dehydrogenase PdxA [Microscillaceae bacterium]|nr:4-hydroxythreonine-4-phosphate dehydrogenase PdxA [Microscillaceae bacterium]MDW8461205.1 4-hydroxythreonine-4-phosphate dehydrogenase PdxA [Cytophagales bacterium]